jgi:uridine kinase
MKKLFTSPWFLIGLALRLTMIALLIPRATTIWYVPFMDDSTAQLTLDPWQTFLGHGGSSAAFPYGYVMWLVFLPLTLLAKLTGAPLHLAYGLTLLAVDTGLLATLRQLFTASHQKLLLTYWLSPIVILASYWLGLNDLVPVLLLSLALYFTRNLQLKHAGFLYGAAVSAKLSMILAAPLFLIYLYQNKALRQKLPDYLTGLLGSSLLFGLPFLASKAGLHMLLSNPEMGKVYQFSLELGKGSVIHLLPMAYFLMLYLTWRVRRLNFDLFTTLLGLAFFLVVLMTPASPGWFTWILPLLVAYQINSDRVAVLLVAGFSTMYALANVLVIPSPALSIAVPEDWPTTATLAIPLTSTFSLIHTFIAALGVVLGLRIWRETIGSNDYFRLSRKPFVIGIAGDSGAGKDTLSDALVGLFGRHSVATLSGDDYHLWDRQKPMWQVMTHLNPMANDLESYANDLIALTDGREISARHYDHQTGKMSRPAHIKSNDIIIASGLHALYLPILRQCYDLSIYLDIDEGLRRYLKVVRDVHQRGHTEERVLSSLAKREPDSERFVRPQAEHADLVMSLLPIHPRLLNDTSGKQALRYKLEVRSKNSLNEMSLTRVLTGVCGLHVDVTINHDGSEVQMIIEGESSAEDMALGAHMLFPKLLAFLDIAPQWQNGVLGLMQLITLSHINQALSKRFLW